MEERFAASPGCDGGGGGFLDAEAVGAAAVMVDVVDKLDAFGAAEGKEVAGGLGAVVVLEGETAAGAPGETGQIAAEGFERRGFVTVSAAGVDIEGVGMGPFGDLGLILELGDGAADDAFVRGIEDDELIGMETGAEVFGLGEFAAALEAP